MALAGNLRARRMLVGIAENNKTVQRRIIDELINQKNLDLADELFSEDHELHPEALEVGRGPEGMKRAFAGLHEEFPDVHVDIESIVAEGDMVAVRLTFSGTHAPSGDRATWPEMVFARFSEGKAVESREVTDTGRGWDSPPW
jgi:predicted ester cyclase